MKLQKRKIGLALGKSIQQGSLAAQAAIPEIKQKLKA
jgi:hypothetical protein